MASKKVPVTITFFHEGTVPPVYLAGSFSAWAPKEMEYTVESDQHRFTKEVELEPEVSYQYKFRLGHEGNWWVLDEAAPKETDAVGNTNNVITVPKADTSKPSDSSVAPASNDKDQPQVTEHEVQVPTLIVERADEKPAYGDDFGPNATPAQKDAHEIRGADAEPDYTIVHNDPSEEDKEKAKIADEVANSAEAIDGQIPLNPRIRSLQGQSDGHSDGTSTPIRQVADTAAEVADTAAAIDREPTPVPSSDEEAGRTGERRMSSTPINEVADTAAEVADSAATIDKDQDIDDDDDDDDDNNYYTAEIATPAEEKAPMFAYEFAGEAPAGKNVVQERNQREPAPEFLDYTEVDPNDPSIEKFPEDRQGILGKIRTSQTSLSPDETRFDGVPASPVVGHTSSPLFGKGISESPISPMHKASVDTEREPSPPPLDAIKEDEEEADTEIQTPAVKITKTDTMVRELDNRLANVDENEPLSLESGEKSMPTPGFFSGISAPLNTAEPTPSLYMLDRLHGGILSGAGASSRGAAADGNTPREEKKLSLSSVSEDASSSTPNAKDPQADTPIKDTKEQKVKREIGSKKAEQHPAPVKVVPEVQGAVEKAREYGKGIGAKVVDNVRKFEARASESGGQSPRDQSPGGQVKDGTKTSEASRSGRSQVDGGRSVSGSSAHEPGKGTTDAMDHVTGEHVRIDGSNDTVTSSTVDVDERSRLNGGKVTKRKDTQLPARPPSAQSVRPASDESGKPNRGWLKSIWHTVVIGWFGGLMRKLGLWGGAGGLGERAGGNARHTASGSANGRRQFVSIVLFLGAVLPAFMVLYAENKKVHWRGEEASMYVRDWVERPMQAMNKAWTVTRLFIIPGNIEATRGT